VVGPQLIRPALRPWTGGLALLSAAVVAVLALRYRGASGAGRLDTWVVAEVAASTSGHGPVVDVLVSAGNPACVATAAAVCAAACLVLRRPRHAVLAVLGPAVTGAVTTALKPVVGRTLDGDLALPSGHTAGVTSVCLVLALLLLDLRGRAVPAPAARGLAVLLAVPVPAAVAGALVASGSHYPTDTLAGFCTAVSVTSALALVVDGRSPARAAPVEPGSARPPTR
jgi:undecaprenyl-diphosphatase